VSERTYRRLTRNAAFAVVHGVVVLVSLSGLSGTFAGPLVFFASVPLMLAWGTFQADIAMNPELGDDGRVRWRVALFCLPWSMAVYWHRYVRSSQPSA